VLWFSALESQCRVVQHPPHLSSQANAAPTTLGRISTDGVLGLNPSRGRQDQDIMRINLCGMEALHLIELLWLHSIGKGGDPA
jgi:hypothetical protein